MNFLSTLSKAQLGVFAFGQSPPEVLYFIIKDSGLVQTVLQPLRTSSGCCNLLLISSGVEHKVLALCVRVLITLYFEAKLWLLSH